MASARAASVAGRSAGGPEAGAARRRSGVASGDAPSRVLRHRQQHRVEAEQIRRAHLRVLGVEDGAILGDEGLPWIARIFILL